MSLYQLWQPWTTLSSPITLILQQLIQTVPSSYLTLLPLLLDCTSRWAFELSAFPCQSSNFYFFILNFSPLQIVECDSSANSTEPQQYIRTVLNDAVVPMNEDQGCTPSADGLCLLSDFVKYQQESAVQAANFDYACFGDYNVTKPVRNGTVYGSLWSDRRTACLHSFHLPPLFATFFAQPILAVTHL